ncbi:MAG: ABC transporter permease [Myxococcota bacterium]
MRHLLIRFGFYALAAWVSITLNFFLPRLMPGDAATAMFGRFQGKMSPEALVALKQAFGFTDAPLWEQYLTYLGHLLQGDLGISISNFPKPVSELIAGGLLWTSVVAGSALVIAFLIGTALGTLIAWRRGRLLDRTLPPTFALLGTFPYFWLAMVALWVFGFQLGWFPLRHAYSAHLEPAWTFTFISDVIAHAALPVASVVVATVGGWMMGMRNTMIAVLGEDYIRLAHAKGLPPRQVMMRYAARNALLPNVTSFGMAVGFVLGGALLTEIVFSYPGTGYLLLQAVRSQDYPLMQGLFLAITMAVLLANWVVDLVVLWLDPRTR